MKNRFETFLSSKGDIGESSKRSDKVFTIEDKQQLLQVLGELLKRLEHKKIVKSKMLLGTRILEKKLNWLTSHIKHLKESIANPNTQPYIPSVTEANLMYAKRLKNIDLIPDPEESIISYGEGAGLEKYRPNVFSKKNPDLSLQEGDIGEDDPADVVGFKE